MHSLGKYYNLANIHFPDLPAHCLSGNQQQLNVCLFPISYQALHCCKCLDFKGNVLLLVQIVHEIQSIIHLQITDCKDVFLQYTPPA